MTRLELLHPLEWVPGPDVECLRQQVQGCVPALEVLQTGFDPSVLNFSDAYYDTLGLEKPKRGMQRKEKPLFEFPPITFDLYQEDDP